MFTSSTFQGQVLSGFAAASERSSRLEAGRGLSVDLLGSNTVSLQSHGCGDDLTEEDIWSSFDASQPAEDSSNDSRGRVVGHSADGHLPSLRLNSRARPEALPVAGFEFSTHQPQGLAALSSDFAPSSHFANQPNASADGLHKGVAGFAPVMIPSITNKLDGSHQAPYRASAPVNVPDWSKISGISSKFSRHFNQFDSDDDKMVPPHELVARNQPDDGAFSVCEGVGRTLRGRDLDRLRTTILRKTGFYEP